MTEGIVYVLTNPSMPGMVKIGMTTRETADLRMAELVKPARVSLARDDLRSILEK